MSTIVRKMPRDAAGLTPAEVTSVQTNLGIVAAGAGFATQPEAEDGLVPNKLMSPLRSKQAIDFQRPFASNAETVAGAITNKVTAPSGVKAAVDAAAFSAGSYVMATDPQAAASTVENVVINPKQLGDGGPLVVNGLHGLYDRIQKISRNSPTGTLLTGIAFGDSLKDRVSGYLLRSLQGQYSYANVGTSLATLANPESGTGTYGGIISYGLSGGAAAVGSGTDYTIWPTGDYYTVPNAGTISMGGTASTAARWAWFYIVEPGAGTFELETSPDGSTWTSRATVNAAGTKAGAVAAYSATATNFSRIRVTSGTVKVVGASVRPTAERGTMMGGIGVGGLSIANAALTPSAVMVPILTDIAPDIVTIHMDDAGSLMASHLPTVAGWFRAANPKCAVVLIGNGPKTGAEADQVAQNAVYRQLALTSPGYAMVDGMRLLRSVAWLTTIGWIGDGTHLVDDAYGMMGSVLVNGLAATGQGLFGRSLLPLVRYAADATVKARVIEIGRAETQTPAATISTDGSFGFDMSIALNRALGVGPAGDQGFAISLNNAAVASQLPSTIRLGGTAGDSWLRRIYPGYYGLVSTATGFNLSAQFTAQNIIGWLAANSNRALSVGNGWLSDFGGNPLSYSLPATSLVGDTVGIIGVGSGGWTITQGTGQQIVDAGAATTAGVGGSLVGGQRKTVVLVCVVANTTWQVVESRGSLTFN